MNNTKVLIIDDEPDIRELLSLTLRRMDLACDAAASFHDGLSYIDRNDYALVLTDMRLPDGSGYDIVKYIQQHKPSIPVAVITAFGNVEGAVNTLKAGAFDYVSKPIDLPMLKNIVSKALNMVKSPTVIMDDVMVGKSEVMKVLRDSIKKLSRSQAPVFIKGESGVGKELAARLIHNNGPRSDQPFIPVNCGAIASELMESEFFGHVKGSFTGAIADKDGLFVAAQGGTLFLDEVAELPLSMQVKLLRAIQERSVKPVGALREIPVDVRILSASNKSLVEEIAANRFRHELYYRINVIELNVPSLRERAGDIQLLAEFLVSKIVQKHGCEPVLFTKESITALKKYDFPGNVRELENILERAVTLCDGNQIDVDDLALTKITPNMKSIDSSKFTGSLDNALEMHEKELIMQALEQTKWNRTAAAKLLGVSFRVLRYRLKKLGIE